jgi:hypothetical protein
MPIKIPNDLPARPVLEREGVMVMSESDAVRQDVRPLRIGLLNLMPDKARTETQLARLVGATPLQVEMTLIRIASHTPKNTPLEHMTAFYRDWASIAEEKFDGLLVTGAPVELLDFEDVGYWDELCAIFDWTQSTSTRRSPSAGAPRPRSTTSTRCPSTHCPGRSSASTATATCRPHRPICAASPTTSPSPCRAGPRCAAQSFPATPASRC